jgi:Senescence-associated protein
MFCTADKVMDAVEVAERRSLAATSNVVSGAVSKRYGITIISRRHYSHNQNFVN